jgi:lipoprotein NlpI
MKLDEKNEGGVRVEALRLRAQLYASKNDLDAAIADQDEAIRLVPQLAALYLDRARLWNRKGDDRRTIADFDKAIELEPKNAALYLTRGDFFRNKGDYERAIRNYDQAIERQADYPMAYGNRGLARFYKGDFVDAMNDFQRVGNERANTYSMLMLWVARARAGRSDAIGELSKTAGKLKSGEWPYPIVELYLGRRSPDETLSAATKPGERCEAQFYVGQFHLARGARALAAKSLQSAVDTCPKDFVEYRGAVEELKQFK